MCNNAGGLTLLRTHGLPVEVMVEDLSSVVELGCGAAIVVSLHNDLRAPNTCTILLLSDTLVQCCMAAD